MRERIAAIVVVEDDKGMRESMEFLLESHGFNVVSLATSHDLHENISGLNVGCLILDVHLPGPDGLAVYEALATARPGLQTIFITGQIDGRIRTEAKRLGAVALLEKPYSDAMLLEALDRALKFSA